VDVESTMYLFYFPVMFVTFFVRSSTQLEKDKDTETESMGRVYACWIRTNSQLYLKNLIKYSQNLPLHHVPNIHMSHHS